MRYARGAPARHGSGRRARTPLGEITLLRSLPNLERRSHGDAVDVGLRESGALPAVGVFEVGREVEAVVDGPAQARAEDEAVALAVVLGLDARPGGGEPADQLAREVLG